ncbi:IclR family transcriptional regulator [Fictibacillus enclensis]|uniref:IclR family transcriptional regulator n=1 Tax=Fictibacillus enclensis TaxID=1017270 RepID=UPI00259FE1A8|nr:IclR family transcriptional regulator [Fictibacillus enclensis]MDM5340242.1 IclR family transcriptional regulator [Fictibacillus enclensis]
MKEIKMNKSAERVVDVLFLLAKSEAPLTLNEICQKLSFPKSSGFELIQTLVVKGFVEVDDARLKTYRLGLGAFEVGSAYLTNNDVTMQARQPIQELNRLVGSTVFLGIEDRGKIVYLDKAESHSVMRPTAKLGSRRYMHTTGLGKALLAAFPDEKIKYILENGDIAKKTEFSKVTIPEILNDVRGTRERGYSIDDREDNVEMFCMGSAIFDQWNEPVASISVASSYNGMTVEKKKLITELLQKTALDISKKLGYKGDRLYI